MSLADAQADIVSALEMLQESGEQAVFSYQTDPVFNDDTGDLISGGTSRTQIAYGYPESYSNSEIDGSSIQRGDIKLIWHIHQLVCSICEKASILPVQIILLSNTAVQLTIVDTTRSRS